MSELREFPRAVVDGSLKLHAMRRIPFPLSKFVYGSESVIITHETIVPIQDWIRRNFNPSTYPKVVYDFTRSCGLFAMLMAATIGCEVIFIRINGSLEDQATRHNVRKLREFDSQYYHITRFTFSEHEITNDLAGGKSRSVAIVDDKTADPVRIDCCLRLAQQCIYFGSVRTGSPISYLISNQIPPLSMNTYRKYSIDKNVSVNDSLHAFVIRDGSNNK